MASAGAQPQCCPFEGGRRVLELVAGWIITCIVREMKETDEYVSRLLMPVHGQHRPTLALLQRLIAGRWLRHLRHPESRAWNEG